METTKTLAEAVQGYLKTIQEARSQNTARAYANAMDAFMRVLKEHWIEAESPVSQLSEDGAAWMLSYLKVYSSATERLYTQAVKGFYQYLAGEKMAEVNLPRLDLFIRNRTRRAGQRLPQFPREDIERVLSFTNEIAAQLSDNP